MSRERSLQVQPGSAQGTRLRSPLACSGGQACELPRAGDGRLKHSPWGEAGGTAARAAAEPHMGIKNSSRMGSTETMALVL